jgi:hypothetical protein
MLNKRWKQQQQRQQLPMYSIVSVPAVTAVAVCVEPAASKRMTCMVQQWKAAASQGAMPALFLGLCLATLRADDPTPCHCMARENRGTA